MILNDNFFFNCVVLFHFHSFATLVPINGERPVGFSLSRLDFLPSKTNLFMLEFCGRDNNFVLIEYCIVFKLGNNICKSYLRWCIIFSSDRA